MNIVENFLELVEIEEIIFTNEYENMVDISVQEDSSFLLSNGIISHNSSIGAFRKYRTPDLQGAFALRGKFINAYEISTKKLSENSEVINVMAAIGLKIGQKAKKEDIRYNKILFYVDADCLDEETIIITKDGEKKIKDITYNDFILTHNNVYKKIKNIIQKDVSFYIKIIVNGNEIICSENHKFLIFRDGEVVEVMAKNITYNDSFLIKK